MLRSSFLALFFPALVLAAEGDIARLGAGGYRASLPPGAKGPPAEFFATESIRPLLPTNRFWSSLLWARFSERQFPHPLAVRALPAGLQVYYPGQSMTVIAVGIIAGMPDGGADLVLGHSDVDQFPDARLDSFSDWFVTASFMSAGRGMKIAYGHGSPFVYAMYQGGNTKITFRADPQIWAGGADSATLGASVGGRHYGLFAPTGVTWAGIGTKSLICRGGAKNWFSLAVLPDNTKETLAMFAAVAHSHVVDTKVQWSYDRPTSQVITRFTYTLKAYEGSANETLFALYPHQWRNTDAALLKSSYASVRGEMKLARGSSFQTSMIFHGVLPALPDAGGADKAKLMSYVQDELRQPTPKAMDTYWEGKYLGRQATLAAIAAQSVDAAPAQKILEQLRNRLQGWLSAADARGEAKNTNVFCYHRPWCTLIGYPPSYGSDNQLNDHHFHYGYFIRAAAEIARNDPAWMADDKFGAMVRLIIRDIACADRADPMFPFLRSFDVYAGHSWASGHAQFADGNNQESSSEATNAWCALILLGQAIGDEKLRDLGIYLYTTEVEAINEYWFDVLGENRPKAYAPPLVTMIWGAKSVNETWFGSKPEQVHTINWLPFHGGSLYLGLYPEYVRRNYEWMVKAKKGANWEMNACLIWMYRALDNPQDAMAQFQKQGESIKIEPGNSRTNLYHWIANLSALGHVNRDVTADWPLYAVFLKDGTRTYVVCNMAREPIEVHFSDGMKVKAGRGIFALRRKM